MEYQQEIQVAKDGGQFTSIQAAIDSITDSSSSKRYLIIVHPGVYTERLVFKSNVDIRGVDADKVSINVTGGSLFTVSATGNRIIDVGATLTATSSSDILIDGSSGGNITIDTSRITLATATADIQPKILNKETGASLTMLRSTFTYSNTSNADNFSETILFDIDGTGTVVIDDVFVITSSNQSSGDVSVFGDNSTSTRAIGTTFVNAFITNPSYTGDFRAYKRAASGGTDSIISMIISISGAGSGTATGIFVDSPTDDEIINFNSSSIDITNFSNNLYSNVGSGDTLNLLFSSVCDDCSNTGAGTTNKIIEQDSVFRVNTEIIDENILLGTPTNESMKDLFNIVFNSGHDFGGIITDNLDGTIDVSAGGGMIRSSDSSVAPIFSFDYPEKLAPDTDIALIDGVNNILYVDYNSGTPEVFVTQNRDSIFDNENDKFELVEIVREGNVLDITDHRHLARSQGQQRSYSIAPVVRANGTGLAMGETGTRNITVTAGKIWRKYIQQSISSIDTSVSDTFDSYYTTDSFSTWTKVLADTQWNNTQYNDITTGLVALSPSNRFSFQDFYISGGGKLIRIYSQGQFTSLSEAETAPASSTLPAILQNNSLLISRVVFQGNDATAQSILSAFDVTFDPASISDHGSLSGLPDDDHPQYLPIDGTRNMTGILTAPSIFTTDLDISGSLTFGVGGVSTDDFKIEKFDPSIIFDALTAGDTDFWAGVIDDGQGDDDDVFQIGDGTTPGTNPFLTINTTGNVGIGTTDPIAMMDISGSASAIRIAQNETPVTIKSHAIVSAQYNSEVETEGYTMMAAQGNSGSNALLYGGGFSSLNAATSHQFFTATNDSVRAGTQRMLISNSGEVDIGSISGDGTGKVVCIKSDGDLGTCSNQPNGSGICTCS